MWSRFVNIHGWTGHNVSCDIHMEHLHRTCKTAVRSLGANLTPKAISRAGKCLGSITMSTQKLDKQTGVYRPYGTHSNAMTTLSRLSGCTNNDTITSFNDLSVQLVYMSTSRYLGMFGASRGSVNATPNCVFNCSYTSATSLCLRQYIMILFAILPLFSMCVAIGCIASASALFDLTKYAMFVFVGGK